MNERINVSLEDLARAIEAVEELAANLAKADGHITPQCKADHIILFLVLSSSGPTDQIPPEPLAPTMANLTAEAVVTLIQKVLKDVPPIEKAAFIARANELLTANHPNPRNQP